jgi:pentatricopeptide repeat protein
LAVTDYCQLGPCRQNITVLHSCTNCVPIFCLQLTTTRRQLREFERKGKISRLEYKDWEMFQTYESNLHTEAEQIARWALEEEVPEAIPSVHERLLAMYCISGKALEAEKSLWGMKLAGREPPWEMYNTVLGICGYRNEKEAVYRILRRMEEGQKHPVKRSYSVLMGGFVKGGHVESAAEIMHLMIEKKVNPDPNVMMAVLRALQKSELVGSYLKLCKSLAQAGLIEPCLLYFYIDAFNLCIIRML